MKGIISIEALTTILKKQSSPITNMLINLLSEFVNLKGSTFINVMNYYSNSQDSRSNYQMHIGIKPETVKNKQLEVLNTLDYNDLYVRFPNAKDKGGHHHFFSEYHFREAIQNVRKGLTNPSRTRSLAQIDAYEQICEGIDYNANTNTVYIRGYVMKVYNNEEKYKLHFRGNGSYVKQRTQTVANEIVRKICEKGAGYSFKNLPIRLDQTEQLKVKVNGTIYEL